MIRLNPESSGESSAPKPSSLDKPLEPRPSDLYEPRMIRRTFLNLRDNLNRLKGGVEDFEAKEDGKTKYSVQLQGDVIAITDFEQSRTYFLTEEGARMQDMKTKGPAPVDTRRLAEIADDVEQLGKKKEEANGNA